MKCYYGLLGVGCAPFSQVVYGWRTSLHLKCHWLPWQGKGTRRLCFWLKFFCFEVTHAHSPLAKNSPMPLPLWKGVAHLTMTCWDSRAPPNTPHSQPQQLVLELLKGLSSLLVTLSYIMGSTDPFRRSSRHIFFFRNSSWGEALTSWKTDIVPFFTRNEYHITCMIDSLSVWTKKKLTPKFSSHLQSLCQLRNMVEFLFLLLCYKISIF